MGRTPATVISFGLDYSYLDKDSSDYAVLNLKIPGFDRILGGGQWTDDTEIHIDDLKGSLVRKLGDSERSVIFDGWLEYEHIFSKGKLEKANFRYLYDPSSPKLYRLGTREENKADTNKKAN